MARRRDCGGWSGTPWKSTWQAWRRLAGLGRRAAGPGAAGGPAGQGGGLLPDRGLHARPGPRAPDVRRRRGGRGGGPEASDSSGRGTVAAAGRRRRLRRVHRCGTRPWASRSAAVGTRVGLLPDFPKLPATGDEIASIGRDFKNRFRGAQPDELSGDLATEAALREACLSSIASCTWPRTATSLPRP